MTILAIPKKSPQSLLTFQRNIRPFTSINKYKAIIARYYNRKSEHYLNHNSPLSSRKSMHNMSFGASTLCSSLIILAYMWVASGLSMNHYDITCPNVESIVAKVVGDATSRDKTVPATLLRMHFHDCFLRVGLNF